MGDERDVREGGRRRQTSLVLRGVGGRCDEMWLDGMKLCTSSPTFTATSTHDTLSAPTPTTTPPTTPRHPNPPVTPSPSRRGVLQELPRGLESIGEIVAEIKSETVRVAHTQRQLKQQPADASRAPADDDQGAAPGDIHGAEEEAQGHAAGLEAAGGGRVGVGVGGGGGVVVCGRNFGNAGSVWHKSNTIKLDIASHPPLPYTATATPPQSCSALALALT